MNLKKNNYYYKSNLMKNFLLIGFILFSASAYSQQWLSLNNSACTAIPYTFIESSGILLTTGNCNSTDNGITWTQSSNYLTSLCYAQHSTGIFSGTDEGIFFLGDTGSTWLQVFTSNNKMVVDLINVNDTLFAATVGSGILSSTDNGITWTPVNTGLPTDSIFTVVNSGNMLFAGLYSYGIYMSANSGASWFPANIGLPAIAYIPSINVTSAGIFASNGSALFFSNNNGTSWTASSLTGVTINEIKSVGNALLAGGFTYSGNEGMFRSIDNGITWTLFNNGMPVGCPYGVSEIYSSGNYVYCGMESQCGSIYRMHVNDVLTGNSETDGVNPYECEVFPNPFSNNLMVRTNGKSPSEIILLDATGRKVMQESFTGNAELLPGKLSSGLYFYIINDRAGLVDSGKVVKE